MMRKLKPQAYLDEAYTGVGYTTKTVVNWIKSGKIRGERTPTGRWLVLMDEQPESKVSSLVKMMEAAAT
jgi:predicted site-specific integrase-resolvase